MFIFLVLYILTALYIVVLNYLCKTAPPTNRFTGDFLNLANYICKTQILSCLQGLLAPQKVIIDLYIMFMI